MYKRQIDTFIVLTMTALVIITTKSIPTGLTGAELSQYAFSTLYGKGGAIFIAICMFFFAFSTIVGWYFFGQANVKYLFGPKAVKIYSVLVCICVVLGSLAPVSYTHLDVYKRQVYGCLGTAYGQQFLYEEAAAAYKEAYRLSEDPEMLKAYMYCAYRSMPEAEYVKMLSGNSLYLSMDSLLKEELKQARRSVDMDVTDEKLEIWKKEYRRIDKCC